MLSIYIYIYNYMDVVVHPSHSTEKELYSPGFELVTSGLAMKGLITVC